MALVFTLRPLRISMWYNSSDSAVSTIEDFSASLDWQSPHYLREGKVEVTPKLVNLDGTLTVIFIYLSRKMSFLPISFYSILTTRTTTHPLHTILGSIY